MFAHSILTKSQWLKKITVLNNKHYPSLINYQMVNEHDKDINNEMTVPL